MKKLGWFALSTMVVLLILSGVLLLAANLYVQSQGAQERIRQTLSDALHTPVTIKKTTLTPWEGLRIDGITLHPPDQAGNGSEPADMTMTADSFRLRTAWWPLIAQRRLNVEAVLLDQPQIVWAQDREGRWTWPQQAISRHRKTPRPATSAPDEQQSDPPAATPTQSALPAPETGSPPVPEATPVAQVSSPSGSGSLPVSAVRKLRIRHGSLDLLNEQRSILGRFEEVDVDGQIRDANYASGQVRIQRALHAKSGLSLTDFSSKFAYAADEGLSLTHGRASFAGGELRANYRLQTQALGTPFSADCQINEVDLSRLVQEAGGQIKVMEGRLQGGFNIEGFTDNPERGRANGHVKLIGAQVPNLPLLQMIGDMLHIEDLSHLQFKQAELIGQMEADELIIESIDLGSNNLRIQAKGRYSTREDRLDVHGRLTIDQAVSHQLPEFIEMNFTPCSDEAPGSRYIDFDVTGPINKPTTNLIDRIMAGPTSGLLQNLLAPKPKKQRVKGAKKDDVNRAPATPKSDDN